MIAAAALVLIAALIVLGVALYLLHHAHEIRREQDQTLRDVLRAHERERREDKNRMMHLAGQTWEPPPSERGDFPVDVLYPDGLDVNPEGAFDESVPDPAGAI